MLGGGGEGEAEVGLAAFAPGALERWLNPGRGGGVPGAGSLRESPGRVTCGEDTPRLAGREWERGRALVEPL